MTIPISTVQELNTLFQTERIIKENSRSSIRIVRSREDGTRMICRRFCGSGEVYQRLWEIDCPNLPKVAAVFEEEGVQYVLEEYIQGDILAFILEGGLLTQEQTAEILLQLCRGLETLNRAGIIHRDIKPENVILRGNEAVLIDFDASRLYKPGSGADTQVLGTTGYAAPEQYGFSQTDPRSDIYSMGVLANVLLTGNHPATKLAYGRLRPVIEKCIEVNTDKRYNSAAELAKAVRKSKKRRLILPAALSSAALAVALLLFLLFGGKTQAPASDTHPAVPEISQPAESHTPEISEEPESLIDVQPGQWAGQFGDDGQPIADPMPFSYDLDGDGEEENYVFGTSLHNDHLDSVLVIGDEVNLTEMSGVMRVPVPCVFRVLEDGSYSLAEEFAPLLSNVNLKVWRGTNLNASAPKITAYESDWQGGLRIEYTKEHLGTWVYEATAELGEISLRSVSKTMLIVDK